jgi:hypothetical protein
MQRIHDTKSQAAIEFLLTYGWAILAATIAIGALVYYGFTSTDVLPDKCVFTNSFQCKDYLISAAGGGQIKVKLTNGLGQTIYNPSATISISGAACSFDSITEWSPDTVREITCSPMTLTVKDRVNAKFTVTYAKTPTGYTQIAQGELYSTVQ